MWLVQLATQIIAQDFSPQTAIIFNMQQHYFMHPSHFVTWNAKEEVYSGLRFNKTILFIKIK